MYKNSSIKIYNDLDYIDGVVEYLKVISKKLNLNKKERNRICYALEESLTNSISFCFDSGSEEIIQIDISAIPSGIEVIIKDHGISKNPFVHVPHNIDELVENLSFDDITSKNSDDITAVSDFVIHKIVDSYTYENLGSKGRMIKMSIYSQDSKIDEVKKKKTTSTDKDEHFESIRLSKPNDAISISKLFHGTYGYTYPNDVVYYPDRLEDLLKSVSMVSIVAVSNKNNIIGHISLLRPYKGLKITELGMTTINSFFKEDDIMPKLIDTIMQRAESSIYYGVFSHSLANYKATQQIWKNHGFCDIAILVGYIDTNVSFRDTDGKPSQRESTVINFKLLREIKEVKLYLPKKHKKMIKKLYKNLGIKVKQNKDEVKTISQQSEFVHHITPSLNSAEIILKVAGNDIIEQMSIITKKLCIAKVDIIYLYIDLEDKNVIDNIEEFEKMGYFFVGIFPYYHHNHTLVMEYVNNIKFDYDAITVLTQMAEELKSYIQKSDPNQSGE